MSETLTLIPEQQTSTATIESLAQLALHGATSTAEQGGFTLAEDTAAELQALFTVEDPEVLPLSAHGLSCEYYEKLKRHVYLWPRYKMAEE